MVNLSSWLMGAAAQPHGPTKGDRRPFNEGAVWTPTMARDGLIADADPMLRMLVGCVIA